MGMEYELQHWGGTLAPARGNAAGLPTQLALEPRQITVNNNEVDKEASSNCGGQIVHIQKFFPVTSAYLVKSHHLP